MLLVKTGMELRIGRYSKTGVAHGATVTAANLHDKHPLQEFLRSHREQLGGTACR